MAESVIPETARQACEDWKLARFQSALTVNADDAVMDLQKWGDALAVLVPQLLDQLGETAHLDDALNARLRAENVQLLNQLAAAEQRGDEWRDENTQLARQSRALESEKAQLLDQIAEAKADRDDWNARVRESDERCRQLEAALREIMRTLSGLTPTDAPTGRAYLLAHSALKTERAALLPEPQPETPREKLQREADEVRAELDIHPVPRAGEDRG